MYKALTVDIHCQDAYWAPVRLASSGDHRDHAFETKNSARLSRPSDVKVRGSTATKTCQLNVSRSLGRSAVSSLGTGFVAHVGATLAARHLPLQA